MFYFFPISFMYHVHLFISLHLIIQWNLCNPKPEFSDILYNPTHFPGPFMCRIRQVPLYYVTLLIQTVVHTLSLAETFSINHIQDNFVRYMNMYSTVLKQDFKFSFKSSCNRVDNIKLKVCSQIIHQCNMESVEPVNLYHR